MRNNPRILGSDATEVVPCENGITVWLQFAIEHIEVAQDVECASHTRLNCRLDKLFILGEFGCDRRDVRVGSGNPKLAAKVAISPLLVGAPAENESQIGEVAGIATTDEMETALETAGIALAEESGFIGGVPGALVSECYHDDIPAAALIVRARPSVPDPTAAQAVIENALEPLVEFDIDTTELEEQASEIQRQLQQVTGQYQKMLQEQGQGQ